MAAGDLVKNNLHRIRQQFYPDNQKGFFQERQMLIKALTTPAEYLESRGVRLPEKRLQEILDTIIRGIMHHGNTGRIGYFSAYLLKCVQDHMRFNGERYYEEGKSLRDIVDMALDGLTKKQQARLPDAQDRTTAELAALHNLVNATKVRRKKAAKPTGTQLDLF